MEVCGPEEGDTSGFDTHTHCLLVGSLNCRFWSFHGRTSAALTFDVSCHFCHFYETFLADEPDKFSPQLQQFFGVFFRSMLQRCFAAK